MKEHELVLSDAARIRRERPTYAVHVPAVELRAPLLTRWVTDIARALWRPAPRTGRPVPTAGAVFYLLIDGRRCRVTLEELS